MILVFDGRVLMPFLEKAVVGLPADDDRLRGDPLLNNCKETVAGLIVIRKRSCVTLQIPLKIHCWQSLGP